MISNQSLTCPKGASLTFEIDMDAGTDLTGATAQWALCESWFDNAKIYLIKTGVGEGLFISQDAGVWKITVSLAPTDTLEIPSGLLYHDCKVLLQSGDVEDVANGPFFLDPSVNILLTNAPITRNLRSVPQALGGLGQTVPLTTSVPTRNLSAAQTFGGLGQAATGTVTGGGELPVFTTDFMALSALPAGISLSRATSGTYFDTSGILQTASTNVARFDHAWNGSAWVARGLLIEEARTNLCLQSENLATTWLTDAVSVTSNIATGPDGTATADKIIPAATTAPHDLYQPVTTANGSSHTWIGCAKGAGYNFALISADGAAVRYSALVDLTTGALVSNPTLGSPAGTSTRLTSIGDGWYRIAVTMTTDTVASYVGLAAVSSSGVTINADNNPVFTGDGTSGVLFTDAQLEGGSYPTSYIHTTTAPVMRSADVPGSNAPLTGYLAAGPSVWEFEDQATGTIARNAYAAGAFDWPTGKWYRSMGVYPPGTDTGSHMAVGGPY